MLPSTRADGLLAACLEATEGRDCELQERQKSLRDEEKYKSSKELKR
jgi:hypothetical protein